MSTEADHVNPAEVPVDTGNSVGPDDGPQDDIDQSALPDFDEDLVDGATLEDDE